MGHGMFLCGLGPGKPGLPAGNLSRGCQCQPLVVTEVVEMVVGVGRLLPGLWALAGWG